MESFNLDEYLENPSRKVVTRDGKDVKIHCTNFDGFLPVIAQVEGFCISQAYHKDGRLFDTKDSPFDLFFSPEKREGWVNIFKRIDGGNYTGTRIFKSKEDAEKDGKYCDFYAATIKIEWAE